jgi:molybdopterin-guanine dinucleotide biosynthesis protein B
VKTPVVAVVGGKKVGKTTTTENLISQLTKRGYKVAALKHISEEDFTLDTPGKDTWRFAQSGAKTIIAMGPNEVATIEKGSTTNLPLTALLKKCKGNDIILIEGFKKAVAKKTSTPKIVVVTSQEEATNALQKYKPILAFSGPYNTEPLNWDIPYVNALKNPEKLANLIETKLLKK